MTEVKLDFDLDQSDDAVEILEAQADLAEIRYMLKHDPEFFIEFFLGEELEFPVPDLHKIIFARMTDLELVRMLLAIPRGHAKTTLAKLAVVWYFLFSEYRFCVYLSNTSTIAQQACKDIIGFIQSENFASVFGAPKMLKQSQNEGMWQFEISLGNGRIKVCTLRAAGANQQMRGINIDNRRPDITVVDDLEDLENTGSPNLQKKLDKWVFGTFIKAFARRFKLIWIGNMLAPTALLARLSKIESWNPIVFGALVQDKKTGRLVPLWPDLWPIEKLQQDLQEYKDLGLLETWMCEMMNMPGHGENGFSQSQINYVKPVPPEDLEGAYLTLDPAFGEDAVLHDSSAIVVHGIPKEDIPRVLEYETGNMREHYAFYTMLEYARKYNAWVWGIESAAQQSALLTLFKMYAAAEQEHNIEFVPLSHNNRSKGKRISAWVSAMEAKTYGIPWNDMDITTQLLSYDMTVEEQADDLVDACAYGLDMFDRHYGLILSQFVAMNNRETEWPKPVYGRRLSGA